MDLGLTNGVAMVAAASKESGTLVPMSWHEGARVFLFALAG